MAVISSLGTLLLEKANKGSDKQDGPMEVRGESGQLPKTPDRQLKIVDPKKSPFFHS